MHTLETLSELLIQHSDWKLHPSYPMLIKRVDYVAKGVIDPAQDCSLEYLQDNHGDCASVLPSHEGSLIRLDLNIVFSEIWDCPVLYFLGSRLDSGEPLSLDRLYANSSSVPTRISQKVSLVLVHSIHSCIRFFICHFITCIRVRQTIFSNFVRHRKINFCSGCQ